MEIVIQILLGLSVIGFGVLLWKSAERWTWVPLVIAPIVFIEAGVFVSMVALSAKSRVAWQKISVELEDRLAKASDEEATLKYGSIGSADAQRAVVPLELSLQKLRVGMGRVWRGMQPQGPMTLSMPAGSDAPAPAPGAPPADGAAPAPAPAGDTSTIDVGTIVFAFSEVQNENGNPLPQVFLGQYRIAQSNPQSVQLEPVRPVNTLAQRQQQAIAGASSWALYELIPVDAHEPFFTEASRARDDAIFGDVDTEFLNQVFAGKLPDADLQAYLKDGQQAQADDPPEARWLKIELLKDHSIVVDGSSQLTPTDGEYFDLLGRAEDRSLQIEEGDEVKFKSGTELVLKAEAANELITTGVAKLIDEIYVRPLNDYDEIERNVLQRLDTLAEQEQILNREIAVLQDVQAKNSTMLVSGQEEKLKLESELKQYRIEKAAILAFKEELEKRHQALRTQLAALYKDNLKTVRELEQAQMLLKQQIDQRTRAAGTF